MSLRSCGLRTTMRRENAKLYPRHCERSEAIHCLLVHRKMDCFAALAMTWADRSPLARMICGIGDRLPEVASLIRATTALIRLRAVRRFRRRRLPSASGKPLDHGAHRIARL